MRKFIKVLILLPITFILSGCFLTFQPRPEPTFIGDYPELFTVAVRSMLGVGDLTVRGSGGVTIIEVDDYGRVLFEYTEACCGHSSRLIMQKTDGDYVYFYPYYNFILNTRRAISRVEHVPDFQEDEVRERWIELQQELRNRIENELDESDVREAMDSILRSTDDFPARQMEALKQANSWNKPMSDTSEFVRVPITREQERGPVPPEILLAAHNEVAINIFGIRRPMVSVNGIHLNLLYLRTDDYGRSIYASSQRVYLFQPDYSFCIETGFLEIADRWRYQTELRLFMEANGWNRRIVSE